MSVELNDARDAYCSMLCELTEAEQVEEINQFLREMAKRTEARQAQCIYINLEDTMGHYPY